MISWFKVDLWKSECRLKVKSACLNFTEKIVCDYCLCCLTECIKFFSGCCRLS